MANNLLDAIRQNMNQKPAAPVQNNTAQVANVLQTKATGKAAPGAPAPALSNIAEQTAQVATQADQRQVQMQGQAQAQQLGMQAQAADQQIQLAQDMQDEQEEDARSRILNETQQLLSEYQQGVRTLDAQRDKSRLEQIGFGLRLTNDEYLNRLQREGKRSRLDNASRFQEELARTIFAEEEELLRDDLSFRALLKADDREFERRMANISIEDALRIAAADNKAANSQIMWQSIGNLAGAGIEAWAKDTPSSTQATNSPDKKAP